MAVIGSVYASVYASRLAAKLPPQMPHRVAGAAEASVGAALVSAERLAVAGHGLLAGLLHAGASDAFIDGLHTGCLVAAGVAAAGAVLAAARLPAQPLKTEPPAEVGAARRGPGAGGGAALRSSSP